MQVNIEKILPVTEARDRFNQIVDEVEGTDELYVMTKNGKPSAVIVGVNHLEKLTGETQENVIAKINTAPTVEPAIEPTAQPIAPATDPFATPPAEANTSLPEEPAETMPAAPAPMPTTPNPAPTADAGINQPATPPPAPQTAMPADSDQNANPVLPPKE